MWEKLDMNLAFVFTRQKLTISDEAFLSALVHEQCVVIVSVFLKF
jgi:hypothetical protein